VNPVMLRETKTYVTGGDVVAVRYLNKTDRFNPSYVLQFARRVQYSEHPDYPAGSLVWEDVPHVERPG
jgi:hypothetical protein